MKYKIYVLLLLLVMFAGLSKVDAYMCYYASETVAGRIDITEGMYAQIDRIGIKPRESNTEYHVANCYINNYIDLSLDEGEVYYEDKERFLVPSYEPDVTNPSCPNYLIFYDKGGNRGGVFVTNDEKIALGARSHFDSAEVKRYDSKLYYAHSLYDAPPYIYGPTTPEQEKMLEQEEKKQSQEYWDKAAVFYTYNGVMLTGDDVCDLDDPNCDLFKVCGLLLGFKDDPDSIRSLLNDILKYVRIIVPILIVLLGSFDFGRAMLSGKEDEMKKAQITFIKRIVAGVVIFFIPALVNVIMWIANNIWSYTTCEL